MERGNEYKNDSIFFLIFILNAVLKLVLQN